jgi:hypothetical protein
MSEQKEQNPIVKAFKVGTIGIWVLVAGAGILLALNTRTSTIKKTSSTKPSVQPSTIPIATPLVASSSPSPVVVVTSPSAVVQPQSTPEVVVVTPTTSAVVQSQPTSSPVAKTPSLKAEVEPAQEKIEISNSSIDTAAYCAANAGLSSCPQGDNKILSELLKRQSQCVDKAEKKATEQEGSLSDMKSLGIFYDCRSSSGMHRFNMAKERYSNRTKTQSR